MLCHFEMRKALLWIISASLPAFCTPLAAQTEDHALRIISPTKDMLVRPGRKVPVKITGSIELMALGVWGSSLHGEGSDLNVSSISAPLGKSPWTVMFDVPLEVDPQQYSIWAMGISTEGVGVRSTEITIDVEPADIPPVTFHPPFVLMPYGGWCVSLTNKSSCGPPLEIYGKYPDGTEVNLNWSTRITYAPQDPSIARVSRDKSSLFGVSPGKTKVVVFGKYVIDVTVLSKDQTRQ